LQIVPNPELFSNAEKQLNLPVVPESLSHAKTILQTHQLGLERQKKFQ
jgi:hypothetical protein